MTHKDESNKKKKRNSSNAVKTQQSYPGEVFWRRLGESCSFYKERCRVSALPVTTRL
jgi:hypothetical protein